MMNHKEYNRPLEFDIEQVKKRNKMKDKEEMKKYKQLYTDTIADLNDYKNLYIRQRSEMENYSKYKEREIENIRKNASSDLINELLPVLDTLDAGIAHDPKLEPVRSQLLKVLKSHGLQVLEVKGTRYDPNIEEAIGVLDQGEDGTVLEEVQKGYTLNGNVLRTSKVIVSKR